MFRVSNGDLNTSALQTNNEPEECQKPQESHLGRGNRQPRTRTTSRNFTRTLPSSVALHALIVISRIFTIEDISIRSIKIYLLLLSGGFLLVVMNGLIPLLHPTVVDNLNRSTLGIPLYCRW